MKYHKYLPATIGVLGLITYILTFFYTSSIINFNTSLCLFIAGTVLSLLFGYMKWSDDMLAGWLGLLINLLPLSVLGFIFMNTHFK